MLGKSIRQMVNSWFSQLLSEAYENVTLIADRRRSSKHRSAGSKISSKIGQLTCRHPVGTHHKL